MSAEPEFNSYRSPVLATRGMVATSQPLAVAAGLEILQQGGNAADAAVATAAALNVTEPTSTGIGGDCFALYYNATTRRVTALNGSGRAPAALTLEKLATDGFTDTLPPFHAHTVTVPGAAAGWHDLIAAHGTLPLTKILAPAIRLAEDGFPVAPLTAHFWANGANRQLKQSPSGAELLIDDRAPRPGEIFRNPGLARTFRTLAEGGKTAFYTGPIAETIAATVQQHGGVLTVADLAAHTTTWESPITTDFHGLRVWECPPNGQGLAALLALNILRGLDLESTAPRSVERLHLQIEALRLAFADTRWYVTDPAFQSIPLEQLLSEAYAAERRKLIDPQRANPTVHRGTPHASSDTVYLSVVDGQGNACSFINSNYMGFGTGLVPTGWGFTLQNRGHNFSLDPAHPNALAPGKRPYHTIIPGLLTHADDDALYGPFGVMGGFMQPQGHMQVVVNLTLDRLDPQSALDHPRFCLDPDATTAPVYFEPEYGLETLSLLARRGHCPLPVHGYGRAMLGRGQIIRRDSTGVLWGGSDPRADGCAMGF